MTATMDDPQIARDEDLARAFDALSIRSRISLLRRLRQPRLLSEIDLPGAPSRDVDHARPLARQTIKEHLDRLTEAGFVNARDAQRDKRSTVEYIVNHQMLYAIAEEFRELAGMRPSAEIEARTVMRAGGRQATGIPGPCLVLAKGIDEGRTFDLSPTRTGSSRWVLGRNRSCEVALDFDPFVSGENSAIVWSHGRHQLVDLREAKNGTSLNFAPLERGATVQLAHGDAIGVGRSLLIYRA